MSGTDAYLRPSSITIPSTGLRVETTTEESDDLARHKRWRETILFGAALIMFSAVFIVSLWFAFLGAGADVETR